VCSLSFQNLCSPRSGLTRGSPVPCSYPRDLCSRDILLEQTMTKSEAKTLLKFLHSKHRRPACLPSARTFYESRTQWVQTFLMSQLPCPPGTLIVTRPSFWISFHASEYRLCRLSECLSSWAHFFCFCLDVLVAARYGLSLVKLDHLLSGAWSLYT